MPSVPLLLSYIPSDSEFDLPLRNTEKAVAKIWQTPRHRNYTGHTVAHSRIILDHLAPLARDCNLSEAETYVLASATYLHDIGMQWEGRSLIEEVLQVSNPTLLASGANLGDEELVRDIHEELGAKWIENSALDPGHPSELGVLHDYAAPIAQVVRAHRTTRLESAEYTDQPIAAGTIRVALLGALLHLADELELDFRRVDMMQLNFRDVPEISQAHWYRHYYVQAVTIKPDEGYIHIHYRLPNADRALYENLVAHPIHERIRKKLDSLDPFLYPHKARFKLSDPDILELVTLQSLPSDILAVLQQLEAGHRLARVDQQTLQVARERQELDSTQRDRVQQANQLHASGKTIEAADVLMDVADGLMKQRRYMSAAQYYEDASAWLVESANLPKAFSCYKGATRAYLDAANPHFGIMTGQQMMQVAEQLGDVEPQIEANALMGRLFNSLFDPARAAAHNRRALELRRSQANE